MWFLWSSLFSFAFPIPIVIDLFKRHDLLMFPIDELFPQPVPSKNYEDAASWLLLVFGGTMFSIGSLYFVYEFKRPEPPLHFPTNRHLKTHGLCAAWAYFIGTLVAIPYALMFVFTEPTWISYWVLTAMAFTAVYLNGLFVFYSYPIDPGTPYKTVLFPMLRRVFCCCVRDTPFWKRHFGTDWLIVTWFILFGCYVWILGSVFIIYMSESTYHYYLSLTSLIDAIGFTIGSMYFVAGSYGNDGLGGISPSRKFDHASHEHPHQPAAAAESPGHHQVGVRG